MRRYEDIHWYSTQYEDCCILLRTLSQHVTYLKYLDAAESTIIYRQIISRHV